ncbi:MAG: hypothetical protein V4568_14130 [Pseudomonadota bacterium]
MEKTVIEDQEPASYTIPTITMSDAQPFLRLQEDCSQAIKDIVAQANKVLQNVNTPENSGEIIKSYVEKRLEHTREKVLVQVKKEDQDRDKQLAQEEVLKKCEEEGIANTFTSFRFNVAVKNAKLGKSVVVRVNPRSGEAFVWQQPTLDQVQLEAKIVIVCGNHQHEVVGRLFVKGERTDKITAGKRGG